MSESRAENRYDLTRGPILRKLALVSVPIMGTQFMQMAYNMTDMFWLGRVEGATVAVAASGLSGLFLWLSVAPEFFGQMGAEIGVSQNLGRGDREAALGFARQALLLSAVLGLLYAALVGAFAHPLVRLFPVDSEGVYQSGALYMRITMIGVPLSYISAALSGMFNGSGNSRLGFTANAVGLGVNIVLDPLMIFVWDWGIAGAAISTVIGQAVVCALCLLFAMRHPQRPFPHFMPALRPDWDKLKAIVRWSYPRVLESALFTLLSMAVSRRVAEFGASSVATQRIGSQIESLGWMVAGGFATAVTAFVGQNYGARMWSRIRTGVKAGMLVMAGWGSLVSLLLFFLGGTLFYVFMPDREIQVMGAHFLRIYACCQVLMCMEGCCAGAFRGIGRTMPPSVCSIASNILRVPLAYVLSGTSLGLTGIWLSIAFTAVLRDVLIVAWYLKAQSGMPKVDAPAQPI